MDTGTVTLTAQEVSDILYKLGYNLGTVEFKEQWQRRFVSADIVGGPAEHFVDNPDLVLSAEDLARIDAMKRGQRYVGGTPRPLPGQSGEELYGRGWDPDAMTAPG